MMRWDDARRVRNGGVAAYMLLFVSDCSPAALIGVGIQVLCRQRIRSGRVRRERFHSDAQPRCMEGGVRRSEEDVEECEMERGGPDRSGET